MKAGAGVHTEVRGSHLDLTHASEDRLGDDKGEEGCGSNGCDGCNAERVDQCGLHQRVVGGGTPERADGLRHRCAATWLGQVLGVC